MGRPRKYIDQALSTDLRIPVTPEQKALIQEAVGLDGIDMAAWARTILLDSAKRRIARTKRRTSKAGTE
jgi:hypothetical protein